MHESPRGRMVAFILAILAPVVTLLLRWPFAAELGDRVLYMTFLPAIAVVAYYGGFWPGQLATVLSTLAATYFLVEPRHTFHISTTHDIVALTLLLLVGTIISGLSESLHQARRRIVAQERQKAEEALSQERYLLHALMDNLPDHIYFKDAASRFLRINKSLATHFRLSDPAQAIARTDFDFFTREHAEQAYADEQKILRTGQPLVGKEERETCPDGSVSWVSTTKMPFRDKDGKIIGTFGLARDFNTFKLAEEAMRESERRWRGLTEALPQLVWSAAPDGACDYFSRQWTEHTGISESDLLGWRWLEVLHPDDRERTRSFWLDSVAGRGPYDVEYRVRRSDGAYRWFKTRGTPIRDDAGGIFKWFGSCTDITDLRETEEALRAAKEAAESANRAKDEFLANVSHEIRTPMNAILGMTELTLETPLAEDQRQCLKTVKTAADNLLGIINDLLDFSKIEAGKLELEPADFSVRSALGDTLRTLAMRAHKKGLELVSHVQPDVHDALVGDAGRLRQVLLNLVGNAIKFTVEGEVVVSVQKSEDRSQKPEETPSSLLASDFCLLEFSVRDTGIGIPADKQQKIFRAFEQEDTSTTRKYGGTGLGLSIAAQLVALMGGTITVDSAPGRGSTFAFTARFERQAHPSEPVTSPPLLLHNLPVLIVDDNATNRHILHEWLHGWQMKPMPVADGVTAMDNLWDAATQGRPYSLVLLDARMPDTDGLVLAGKIRKRAELSATRIILLTSGDIPGDSARLRELRIDSHLLKPVQQDELLETITRVICRTAERRDEGGGMRDEKKSSSLIPPPSSLLILVAEDNEFNSQLLEQLLLRRGHRVRLANNGREALSLSEEGGFDLMLLDIHMPELDGFQVIQAIREREQSAGGHLPVVALTARSRKEDRERCLAAGMDDFLAKPIQSADLWVTMDRVVGAHRSPVRPEPGLLDPSVLLAACGGDAVILEKICQAFRSRLPGQLTAVQDALRERDALRLREAAHKLCGMVSAFSTLAGGVASDLEDQAAEGQLNEARPLAEKLATMAAELMRLVSGLSLEALRQPAPAAEYPNGRTSV